MDNPLIKDLRLRMTKAIGALKDELSTLRTGRASTNILEHILVDAYGTKTPLNQLAAINVPEARLLSVQPWDRGTVKAVEKAIRESDLGLNPMSDGVLIRVPLPELTEERRKELVRLVHKFGEQTKVALRTVRREGIDQLRKAEKNKSISQDEMRQEEKRIQELTDSFVKDVDEVMTHKEADVMQV